MSERPLALRYVDEALACIDAAGGPAGLNLREISRSLGCAHTNAYNYFDGLDDLLGQALVAALEREVEQIRRAIPDDDGDPRAALLAIAEAQIDFELAHPGWFRLVWLEPLRRPPPPRALELMAEAGEVLTRLFREAVESSRSEVDARRLAVDFHTWLHGAVCKAIAGRVASADPEQVRAQLRAQARRILALLIGGES